MKKSSKKSNKKIIIIFIVVISILGIALLMTNNQNRKDLKLSCVLKEAKNSEYLKASRSVKVYQQKDNTIYYDKLEIEFLTEDEEKNNTAKFLLKAKYRADFIKYEEEKNKLNIVMDVNLSKLTKEKISLIGLSDASIEGIQQSLEEAGMICENH